MYRLLYRLDLLNLVLNLVDLSSIVLFSNLVKVKIYLLNLVHVLNRQWCVITGFSNLPACIF
jgi:hypothetical protein